MKMSKEEAQLIAKKGIESRKKYQLPARKKAVLISKSKTK